MAPAAEGDEGVVVVAIVRGREGMGWAERESERWKHRRKMD